MKQFNKKIIAVLIAIVTILTSVFSGVYITPVYAYIDGDAEADKGKDTGSASTVDVAGQICWSGGEQAGYRIYLANGDFWNGEDFLHSKPDEYLFFNTSVNKSGAVWKSTRDYAVYNLNKSNTNCWEFENSSAIAELNSALCFTRDWGTLFEGISGVETLPAYDYTDGDMMISVKNWANSLFGTDGIISSDTDNMEKFLKNYASMTGKTYGDKIPDASTFGEQKWAIIVEPVICLSVKGGGTNDFLVSYQDLTAFKNAFPKNDYIMTENIVKAFQRLYTTVDGKDIRDYDSVSNDPDGDQYNSFAGFAAFFGVNMDLNKPTKASAAVNITRQTFENLSNLLSNPSNSHLVNASDIENNSFPECILF